MPFSNWKEFAAWFALADAWRWTCTLFGRGEVVAKGNLVGGNDILGRASIRFQLETS